VGDQSVNRPLSPPLRKPARSAARRSQPTAPTTDNGYLTRRGRRVQTVINAVCERTHGPIYRWGSMDEPSTGVSPGVHALEATLPKPVIPAQAAKELSSASATTPQPGGFFLRAPCTRLCSVCSFVARPCCFAGTPRAPRLCNKGWLQAGSDSEIFQVLRRKRLQTDFLVLLLLLSFLPSAAPAVGVHVSDVGVAD